MNHAILPVLFAALLAAPAAAQGSRGGGKWKVSERTSPMDDSKTVTLSLDANEPIAVWLDNPTPVLIIRCKEGETDLYVVTESAATPEYGQHDRYTVTLRIDKETAFDDLWGASTDSKALFSSNPIGLARLLRNASVFLFRFTPFNASPAVVTFNVSGLGTHLPKVARACGWSVSPPARPSASPSATPASAPTGHAATLREFLTKPVTLVVAGQRVSGTLVSVGDQLLIVNVNGRWIDYPFERVDNVTRDPGGGSITIVMK